MIRYFNEVTLIGWICAPVTFYPFQKGGCCARTLMAMHRYWKLEFEWATDTFPVEIEAWQEAAKILRRSAELGTLMMIRGTLQCAKWVDKETDKRRTKLFVRARRTWVVEQASTRSKTRFRKGLAELAKLRAGNQVAPLPVEPDHNDRAKPDELGDLPV